MPGCSAPGRSSRTIRNTAISSYPWPSSHSAPVHPAIHQPSNGRTIMRAGFEVEVINGGVAVRQLGADRGSAPFVQVTESKSDRIAVALVGRIFADEPSTHGSSQSPDADAVITAYRRDGE